jgi:hypothetical protein
MFRTNLWFIFRGSPFSNYISYTFMVQIGSKHVGHFLIKIVLNNISSVHLSE